MFATLNGHASLVRLLLKHGADKEMQSAMGQKAVNIAWTVGREDIVKVRKVTIRLMKCLAASCVVCACEGARLFLEKSPREVELQSLTPGPHECCQ